MAKSQRRSQVLVSLDHFSDPRARRILLALARRLTAGTRSDIAEQRVWLIHAVNRVERKDCPETLFVGHILCDLVGQGWTATVRRTVLRLYPPPDAGSPAEEKARIRAAHLVERDAQLALPPVRKFIASMEARRLFKGQWRSVLSLIHEGPELAKRLAVAALTGDEAARAESLRQIVDPYVQVIHGDERCPFTGLRLLDIWRYFRHTWTTTYQSTPGRKLFVLVRNRAQDGHPVMGIGALGSAIVQLSVRDEWIGWLPKDVTETFRKSPSRFRDWLLLQADILIGDIYKGDFVRDSVLTRADLKACPLKVTKRLDEVARDARAAHRLNPEPAQHKSVDRLATVQWRRQATTNLFRWKRAATLSQLIGAKRALLGMGNRIKPCDVDSSSFRKAVSTIVRGIKAKHIGIDVMDITVCGAVAPYNHLLGGKLVSMLMASPDVALAYEQRYRDTPSLIASSMAGRRVVRKPSLVLLGTTSLYGSGASQYHRLRMPVATAKNQYRFEFIELGKTAGYGSYHFSASTMAALESVLRRGRRGRRVNSIFGEGVNPKLRKLRAGFDAVGLPSELLLQHGSPRLVYAVPLSTNFREVLLGLTNRPRWILPRHTAATKILIDYWLDRWVARRICRPQSIDAIAAETLTHPQRHSAKVSVVSEGEWLPFDEHQESTADVITGESERRVS